jgi:hypothetical protein
MSWIARFHIKNALVIANLISNAIGATVVNLLAQISYPTIPERLSQGLERTTLWFTPAAFLFPLVLSVIMRDRFGGISRRSSMERLPTLPRPWRLAADCSTSPSCLS